MLNFRINIFMFYSLFKFIFSTKEIVSESWIVWMKKIINIAQVKSSINAILKMLNPIIEL